MVSYGRQSINLRDVFAVSKALNSEWLTIGPKVKQFEGELEKVTGAETFVVSSGTAALHCAYAALNLRNGDEVITPPNTFVATQATAMHFGAKILFCDIDEKTGNIDHRKVESLITSNTKAITVVDYAGQPADLDSFRKIADKYNLFLIEDAAHSLGSTYRSRPVGSIADLTTFSFFPTKNITTAEGGAVSSNNSELLDKARRYARQGLVKDPNKFIFTPEGRWHQEVQSIGLNYRLPDLLCALGISQIKRLYKFKEIRNEIFEFYCSELGNQPSIKLPVSSDHADPMWHLFPLRVEHGLRDELFEELWRNEIYVQVNYVPAYYHPVFQQLGYQRGLCPVSENFYNEEISLPIHPKLRIKDLKRIVKVIRNFLLDKI
jgi:dTDP-4-amino-4,6-dideoxygalactose transaminase